VLAPLRRVLHHSQFRWFLGSWITASTGYSVYAISIVWLTLQVSHSLLVVGAVLAVEQAAFCATFLVAPLADRVRNQRSIFLASYPVQAVAAAVLGIGALQGRLSVVEILCLVVLLSALWDLSWAAANAAPGILLGPDEQFAVSGVEGLLGGVNSIAGFALGGVLILIVGAGGGMLLYAALLAGATALAVPLRVFPPPSREGSFRESFRAGWKRMASGLGRPLFQLAAVDTVQGFFATGPVLLIALIAVRAFGNSSFVYALFFVAYVLGGVAAGLLVSQWNPRGRVGSLLVGTLLTAGAIFVAVALEPRFLALVVGVWFAAGFALATYQYAKYSFLRGSVSAGELARVVSNLYLFPGVAATVGAAVLGSVGSGLPTSSFALTVAAGLIAAGAIAVGLPAVRALRY
jgi:hypothetical protein